MGKKNNSLKTRILSLLAVVICMGIMLLAARMQKREEGFPLGDFSGVSAEKLEAKYGEKQDPLTLIQLLKVLSYQAEVEKKESVTGKIADYGTELLTMAKEEIIDLEALGEEDETLLELLRIIRSYGAS